jgi:protein phosphatase
MARYEIYGHTETGRVRARNEDHILVGRCVKNRGAMGLWLAPDDDFLAAYGLLLAVADGIGVERHGATASRLALITLERQFYGTVKNPTLEAFQQALESALQHANAAVRSAAEGHPDLAGMGCTLAGVCLTPFGYLVFGCGDSRVYRSRHTMLKPLTADDTVGQREVELGLLDPVSAREQDRTRTLVRWVGSDRFISHLEPGPELRAGDRLLVCTDGLHDLVGDDDLAVALNDDRTPLDRLGQGLAQRALDAAGDDNLSLILFRASTDDDPAADAPSDRARERAEETSP